MTGSASDEVGNLKPAQVTGVEQGELVPVCRACGAVMVLRDPPGGWTPEQRWCGTWWDHPPLPGDPLFGHTSSVLDPSPELLAQLAAMHGK